MRLYRWKPRVPHPLDPEVTVGADVRSIEATPYGVLITRADGSRYLSRFEGVGELDIEPEEFAELNDTSPDTPRPLALKRKRAHKKEDT